MLPLVALAAYLILMILLGIRKHRRKVSLPLTVQTQLKDVLVRISTTPQSQIHTLMPRLWWPPPLAPPDSS